ncbi:MAG: hypothetical protein LBH70_08745 [Spirochaetaceae bacterium]|jgi:hypothetical protein|nr:hypothetical protein [Spirochaetaceae bacterium]
MRLLKPLAIQLYPDKLEAGGEDAYTFEELAALLPELWRENTKERGRCNGHGKSRRRKMY